MSLTKSASYMGCFAIICCIAVGCCEQEKKMIADLQGQNAALNAQNAELRTELNSTKENENNLMSQLSAKEQELAAARKGAQVTAPTAAGTADGWEKGLVGDRVTLTSDIMFRAGEAKLSDAGKKRLDDIASTLKTTYKAMPIRVYGFTDNDPILKTRKLWEDNLDLSANRAMAVTRYLWTKGIAKDSIETVAMGETNFVAANSTKAGKAKNRRVEIIVIKK